MAEDTAPQQPELATSDNTSSEESTELPRIRTYATDMSRVIKSRGETLASIVNKERTTAQRSDAPETEAARPYRRIIIGALIGVFVLAGIGTLIGVFVFSPNETTVIENQGIIFANKTETVAITPDTPALPALTAVRNESTFPLGEILRTVLTQNGEALSATRTAEALGLPDALTREVTDIMVGVHSFDRNQPFIILELGAYDRSFAALLSWERTMGQALGGFFAPLGRRADDAPSLVFVDSVIQNLDVREAQSEWPILYTFPEQRMVIITTNEFTLREILTRLGAAQRGL